MNKIQFARNFEKFRLITFDITDTLLRFRREPVTVYIESAKEFGFPDIDEQKLKRCFSQNFKELAKEYPNFGASTPNMSWQTWWLLLVKKTFCCVNPEMEKSKRLDELSHYLLEIFRTKDCWEHIDCGKSIVQRIRDSGKNVGVISNFDPSLKEVLEEMNIDKDFDFIITSYEANAQKPEKRIFDLALEQIGAKPGEALHIGNSYELDYIGATRNGGWSSILITKNEVELCAVKEGHAYSSICDMVTALETKMILD